MASIWRSPIPRIGYGWSGWMAAGRVMVAEDRFGEIHDQVISPDSRYLAYSIRTRPDWHGLWIYDIAAAHAVSVSDPMEDDDNPVWTTDGKYLLFMSARHEIPAVSESEFNVATVKSTGIYLTTLARDTASPFAPRSDEGAVAKEEHEAEAANRRGEGGGAGDQAGAY